MPVTLPPLSRRHFLRDSVLAGAGAWLAPSLAAMTRRPQPESWALLADTHVAGDAGAISRGVVMTENLRRVVAEVTAAGAAPAGAFVVGDLAFNRGEPADYARFLENIGPLRRRGLPVHLALGNHDARDVFRRAPGLAESSPAAVADKEVLLVRSHWLNWFVLDSLEATNATPGLLGERQLDWLAAALDAEPAKPAAIVVHHNPDPNPHVPGLRDTPALWAVLRRRPQVKIWIHGHTHEWRVSRDESGIHVVNLPATSYVFTAGQPSGWVLAQAHRDRLHLELRCLDRAHPRHGEVVTLAWRPV